MNTWKNTFLNQFKLWSLAIRPKTLPAGISPILIGMAYALNQENLTSWPGFLITLSVALLLQISSNLINDYYDGIRGIDDDQRLGPTRVTQGKLIVPKRVKQVAIFTSSLAFILGLYLSFLGGAPILIIGVISIISSFLYSSGPFPLSHLALGEFLAFLFFGIIATNGTYYIQTREVDLNLLILSLIPALTSATILNINNIRDIHNDGKKGKKTLAVLLGEKKSRYLPLFFISLTLVPSLYFTLNQKEKKFLIPIALFLIFLKNWKEIIVEPINSKFNLYLANTGKYLFLYALILSLVLITTGRIS